jgi:hypothetical protein
MECEKNGERNEAHSVEYGGVPPPTRLWPSTASIPELCVWSMQLHSIQSPSLKQMLLGGPCIRALCLKGG